MSLVSWVSYMLNSMSKLQRSNNKIDDLHKVVNKFDEVGKVHAELDKLQNKID